MTCDWEGKEMATQPNSSKTYILPDANKCRCIDRRVVYPKTMLEEKFATQTFLIRQGEIGL